MSEKQKPKVQRAKVLEAVKFSNPADKEGRKSYPSVYDLLCPMWSEGQLTRQGGKLTIKVDGGAYRVTIECPTEGLQTSMMVPSLVTMLELVESLVNGGQLHWGLTWNRARKNLPVVDDAV